jgi:hypothetical protein
LPGLKNGDLLTAAESAEFDAFLTLDQDIEFQQNLIDRKIPRLSPQNRPYVISSKPANGIGRRRDCFTLLQRAIARFRIEPSKWCLLLW